MTSIKHTSTFKKVSALLVIALTALMMGMAGCSSTSSSNASNASGASNGTAGAEGIGTHHAVLTVEGYEPVTIELDGDSAPLTVQNFMDLAEEGYYDGKTFYRIVDDFCLQGGTLGNSASGSDPSLDAIKGEFALNGIENPLADNFDRGVVAMARTSAPDSATSTFFVTLGTASQVSASLDGQYAAFGTIDDAGMKIIDSIVADYIVNVDEPGMGAITVEDLQPVIQSITITD